MNEAIETIVALVEELTPTERRLLARRLRVSGLLPATEMVTDQNRLGAAPALGTVTARRAETPTAVRGHTVTGGQPAAAGGQGSAGGTTLPLRMANDAGRVAAPGKVVIGAPAASEAGADPHGMAPLPGQAPERPIAIIFDGGSKGNPGYGYGSYALRWPGQAQQIVQLQFGDNVTNNEAEYDTLLAALEAVLKRLVDVDADPVTARWTSAGTRSW